MSEDTTRAAPPMDDNFLAGLVMLYQAYWYARDARAELWDFALEIDELHGTGITNSNLHWLCTESYLEHGQEASVYGDPHRSFKRSTGLDFTPETCFVLTTSGYQFATTTLKAQGLI